ncbi:hypothetical protein BH09BAC1_BH09BAC1_07110 [soil metagenome]
MIRLFSALVLMFLGVNLAFAQTGELSGKVTDEKGEGVPFANVAVKKNGVLITGGSTDFDGYYTIKPLDPGTYDVEITALGYGSVMVTGVSINSDRIRTLNQLVKPESKVIEGVEIIAYRVPLIDKESNSTKTTISAEEIKQLPTRNIQSIASTSAGVFQEDEGSAISIKGSRSTSTEYYIDGIRVRGSTNLPANAIEQLTVITGGVPARYGDATGGIINIVTKGPSRQLNGGVELISSQFLDGFGYNLANFNLTGPIYIKNKGTDSAQAKIGFFIAGEYNYQKDPDPSAIGVYAVKDDVLADLQQNPIVRSPVGGSFISATQTITMDDLEKVKVKPNTARQYYSLSTKLDFKLADNIGFIVGGTVNYNRYNDYIPRNNLFNPENNPLYKELSWRVFARYTQRFGKSSNDPGEAKSPFQNAYYSLQFDYSKVYNTFADEAHGTNAFDYGHLGRYDIYRQPTFEHRQVTYRDSLGRERTLDGYVQTGTRDTLVTFTPSGLNPIAGNFMSRYYELAGANREEYYSNLTDIQSNNGLRNGDATQNVHGIWYNLASRNTGRFGNYGTTNNDQFRLTFIGSVDILRPGNSSRNKHALEFGFEFEQRVDRSYAVAPTGLWGLMRQNVNQHIVDPNLDDLNNFSLLIDGVEYKFDQTCRCFPGAPAFSTYDTILTTQINNGTQTYFDRKLREKLGLGADNLDIINIDTLNPNFLSLDMFSADELLNQGSGFVAYNGYDYKGNKLKGQPSFNDFFTQKDSEGNYTRNVGAFRPIYTAFFVQDKFQFKDLLFNVGLRIDRFDANQKVLSDQYSLYKILTVDEAVEKFNYAVPTGIGGDYKVYVDDFNKTKPEVQGFRNGSKWYTADGVEVADPRVIGSNSPNARPTPLLANSQDNIKSTNFDPNSSFSDYKPQVTVMPRLAFSFNLTDEASFFAHYDILTQRPQGRNFSSPSDYYFFNENITSVFNNPNLKPEKTIDYQLGFRQLVTQNSAITFSAFYREMRDMVQIVQVRFAYPKDYTTFGNVDFGTVKGFSLDFDMRKTRTSNLSLRLNYTLQFAEGTGSNDISQLNLVGSGQPNLRTISPLSYDARHLINLTADYRYGSGANYNGPMSKKGKQILSDFGINIIGRTRSGTPYTQQQNPTAEGKTSVPQRPVPKGSINGARLPWSFRLDLRIDKGFNITPTNKATGKEGRNMYLNVYVWIQNLLDTRNIVKVYSFTGNPEDDGYLSSSIGQQDVKNQLNSQSYTDLYNAWINNPDNYSLPRTIRLGLRFDF